MFHYYSERLHWGQKEQKRSMNHPSVFNDQYSRFNQFQSSTSISVAKTCSSAFMMAVATCSFLLTTKSMSLQIDCNSFPIQFSILIGFPQFEKVVTEL